MQAVFLNGPAEVHRSRQVIYRAKIVRGASIENSSWPLQKSKVPTMGLELSETPKGKHPQSCRVCRGAELQRCEIAVQLNSSPSILPETWIPHPSSPLVRIGSAML